MNTDVLYALGGGALIGVAASILWALNGRIAGISGIVRGLLAPTSGDTAWRVLFASGLVSGGVLGALIAPARFDLRGTPSLAVIAIAGALVGAGTRIGSGCTSGHGVCGISRLSKRSLVATVTFMLTGALTVFFARYLGLYS